MQSQPEAAKENPVDFLFSSSDEDTDPDICQIRITDGGSQPHCAKVSIQGVPVYGIIDSGADITIIGAILFKRVATIARLKKRDFQPANKIPRTYDQKPFALDGRMDLDISFGEKTLQTAVYIKMDAHDQLLLSKGVSSAWDRNLPPRCPKVARRTAQDTYSRGGRS